MCSLNLLVATLDKYKCLLKVFPQLCNSLQNNHEFFEIHLERSTGINNNEGLEAKYSTSETPSLVSLGHLHNNPKCQNY